MKQLWHFLLLTTGLALLSGLAQAATVEARLIRAGGGPAHADQKLADINSKLKVQFGYECYRQLGARQQALPAELGKSVRIDLGEGFTLFLTPLQAAEGQNRTVKLEWYAGKAVLVNSTVRLAPGSHLLIKGPDVANSAIVLAVTLKE